MPTRALLVCLVFLTAGCGYTGPQQLTFFPGAAAYNAENHEWEAPINGWVYQARRWGLVRQASWIWMSGLLEDVEPEHETPESEEAEHARAQIAHQLFDQRASLFTVAGRSAKIVVVKVRGHEFVSPPTDAGGRFSFVIRLTDEQVQELLETGSVPYEGYIFDGPLEKALAAVKAATEAAAPQTAQQDQADTPAPLDKEHKYAEGFVRLVTAAGVAVITDIDDTIKISDVLDRRAMIRRMFLEPFIPVPGMPDAYRHWATQGAEIFYVSASPWQLYTTLSDFTAKSEFPPGVFALKRIGIFDAYMSNLWTSSVQTKQDAIAEICQRFPQRQFILVGDSTEHDHEIYADLARAHPDRILHIYIRDVRNEGRDSPRFTQTFHDIPPSEWTLFQTGADLPAQLADVP